jgi:DNA-binding response OmpR family regulator
MKKKILMVEDEYDVAKTFDDFFSKRGFHFSFTKSGWDALITIDEISPDVILLDLDIADIKGEDVVNRLRDNKCNSKIIVVSGKLMKHKEVQDLYDLGVCAVFKKPACLSDIKSTVLHCLEMDDLFDVDDKDSIDINKQRIWAQSLTHKVTNIANNSRAECEAFLSNLQDGIYNGKTLTEFIDIASEKMEKVIASMDRSASVLRAHFKHYEQQ